MAEGPIKNVLLITADQFRGDCLGCAGHPVVRTPHLDQLAAEGVLFQRHYASAAPCAPSRASIHTGVYMSRHRVVTNGSPLNQALTNWALELREQRGLEPACIGYTDLVPDPRMCDADDVKHWDGGRLEGLDDLSRRNHMGSEAWLRERGIAPHLGDEVLQRYRHPEYRPWNGHNGDAAWMQVPMGLSAIGDAPPLPDGFAAPAVYPAECSDTFVLTDQAIEFVERKRAQKQGWALHLSFLKPHTPILAPEPYNKKFHPDDVDLPSPAVRAGGVGLERALHPFLDCLHEAGVRRPLVQADTGSIAGLEDAELRLLRASYYGLVAEVDDNIGRLLAALRRLGEDGQTLIIFTADHGDLLGDHWLRGKVGFHDGAYHVPMIVKDPRPQADASRGAKVQAFTEGVDVVPTILDYLAGQEHPQCDGRSLRPFVEGARDGGPPTGWRSAAHWEFDFRFRFQGLRKQYGLTMHDSCLTVLRTARRKLVFFGGGVPPLLFDLERDPGELTDVSGDPSYAQDLQRMVQEMLAWRMRHLDQTMTHLQVGTGGPGVRSVLGDAFVPRVAAARGGWRRGGASSALAVLVASTVGVGICSLLMRRARA